MGVDVAQAVVAAGAAALLHADAAGREVELVVEHDDAVERDLQEAHRFAHGLARLVHEGHGLQDQRALAAEMAFRHLAVEARTPRREDTAADDLVHRHESHIVPVPRIARPGIAEPDQQKHRTDGADARRLLLGRSRGLAAGRRSRRCTCRRSCARRGSRTRRRRRRAAAGCPRLRPEPLPLPPHRPPPAPPLRAPRSVRRSTPRWRSCRGSPRARPRASSSVERWIEWPISRPVRSTSKYSGMVAGLVRTVISCSTMFSTPPRLMPGAWPSFLKWTGTCTVMIGVGPDAQEVEMQRLVRHRIDLHVARQDLVARAVDVDLERGG